MMMKIIIISIAMIIKTISICAQDSCCLIYQSVLCHINTEENKKSKSYSTEELTDPTNTKIKLERDLNNRSFHFYIVNKKQDFNLNAVNHWFSKLMNDCEITNKKYIKAKDSITNCILTNKALKGIITDFKDALKINDSSYYSIDTLNKKTFYTPVRILLSDILFSTDNKVALVFARMKIGIYGGDGDIYGFIFKKKKNKWKIHKYKIEYR